MGTCHAARAALGGGFGACCPKRLHVGCLRAELLSALGRSCVGSRDAERWSEAMSERPGGSWPLGLWQPGPMALPACPQGRSGWSRTQCRGCEPGSAGASKPPSEAKGPEETALRPSAAGAPGGSPAASGPWWFWGSVQGPAGLPGCTAQLSLGLTAILGRVRCPLMHPGSPRSSPSPRRAGHVADTRETHAG